MKIMQVNAWLGHLLPTLSQLVTLEQPDILCMQEVFNTERTPNLFDTYKLLQHIQEAGAFEYVFFAPTFSFRSLGVTVRHGNAILSKFPLENQKTVFINGKYAENQTVDTYINNIRNLLLCTANLPDGKTISLATHHGFHDFTPLGNAHTLECAQAVRAAIEKLSGPVIFCGDLNVSPDSPAFKEFEALDMANPVVEQNAQTTLSSVHRLKIDLVCDYIFARKDIKTKNFRVAEEVVSDHKALILEFEL